MRWFLAGYCGLALINISVALNQAPLVTQQPRFYAVKTRRSVGIRCLLSRPHLSHSAQWYKAAKYDAEKTEVVAGQRIKIVTNVPDKTFLFIHDLYVEDSGVYFCKLNNSLWGPGTEVQVVRPFDHKKALYRTRMKDGLIILQGLLLAVCIAAILLRKRNMSEKGDSIYEEPETDHIYEGLAIETCGGGLYEELSVYAQAEGAEAPWE
ncbi:uncharacterized protein cd79b [Siniperca chuatsi]|uniref:uncharacterized protein cd79b n=1 Tax=Siniperca chuatsi TaxID=119488 RepID=UPI001CE04C9E|nr:uncharacterized protein cd79b [Siniperca chuatsi]